MLIADDSWLSGVMQRPAFRVDLPEIDEAAPATLAAHAARCVGGPRPFFFAKIETERVDKVQLLGRAGFAVVDVNVTFDLAAPREDRPLRVDVGECTSAAEAAVLDIAGSCFRFTRFHLDPEVGTEVAHAVKREWVRSYAAKKRGDRLFVAYADGHPAGFLAALVTELGGTRTAVIDLVGVGTDMQKKGVGESLVNRFINHYRSSCEALLVGTQVANTPSIRLYEKLGFSLRKSQYVLHKHG